MVRHEQSESLLDLRMACYDRRLGGVRALTALFAGQADGELVDHAASAAAQLDDLSECGDANALLGVVQPPADPAIQTSVTALRELLFAAEASARAGRYRVARAQAEPLVPAARLIGYAPLLAQILDRVGSLRLNGDDAAGASAAFSEAAMLGDEGHDDGVRSLATFGLARVAVVRGHDDDAMALIRATRSIIRRRGHDERLELEVLRLEAVTLDGMNDFEGALVVARRALREAEVSFGADSFEVAESSLRVGEVAYHLGDLDEAERSYRRAFALTEKIDGPDHVDLADPLHGIALVAYARGDFEGSLAAAEHELRLVEAGLGPGGSRPAEALVEIGRCQVALGHPEVAVATFDRALAIIHAKLPGSRPEADLEDEQATALFDIGHVAEAAAAEENALAIYEKVGTPHEPSAAQVRAGLARARLRQGRAAEALPIVDEALADEKKGLGEDNPTLAYPLAVRGEILLALKRPHEAAASSGEAARLDEKDSGETPGLADELAGRGEALLLDGDVGGAVDVVSRALAILDAKHGTPAQRGRAEFTLARALTAQKSDPARAAGLAEKAHADLVAAGPAEATLADEVTRWQRQH